MRFLFPDHYRTAKQSLLRARVRTLLTITGVAIGIASITAILALSEGVSTTLNRQVAALGERVAIIRPIQPGADISDLSNPTPSNAYSTSPIEERDLESISQLPQTESAAPLMSISGAVSSNDATPKRSYILATSPSFEPINDLQINEGQFIDSVTTQNTTVIGAQLSIELFGTEQSIGRQFQIRGQTFTVIGILKRTNAPINHNNIDLDYTAIIDLESGKLFNGGVAQIQQIDVRAKPGTDMTTFSSQLERTLETNHGGFRDTKVYTGTEITEPTSNLFLFVTATMAIIASISLLVGGVGIMNIMLVGVSERTREIGLRKAVGASNMTVVSQFMIESMIISLLGGFIGFVLGYLLAFIVSMFIPYDPGFSLEIVGWAFLLSIGVGVFFGLYPAIRASRKDPIESLRRMH